MSELTLTLIKLGFLALLWMFVLAVLSVIRSDLFGAKVDAQRFRLSNPSSASTGGNPGGAVPKRMRTVESSGASTDVTDAKSA